MVELSKEKIEKNMSQYILYVVCIWKLNITTSLVCMWQGTFAIPHFFSPLSPFFSADYLIKPYFARLTLNNEQYVEMSV